MLTYVIVYLFVISLFGIGETKKKVYGVEGMRN